MEAAFVITLEVLKRLEQIMRERSGKPDLVLSDYFDYVAGTSTGAIIATCISIGNDGRLHCDVLSREWPRHVQPGRIAETLLA